MRWAGRVVQVSPVYYRVETPGPCSVLSMLLYMNHRAKRDSAAGAGAAALLLAAGSEAL